MTDIVYLQSYWNG